ncbi:MAG: SpoIIE family protein phosphatase [Anaerolineae bacterium]|nr:SpoIIE family protein phosphatase [Anaerolineae bacterium]
MISLGELRVEATIPNLRTVSYFLYGIGHRLQLSEKTLFELELAVEEAAANIVEHAYPPGRLGDLLVQAEAMDDIVRITLTDWGEPFNPESVAPFDRNAPIEARMKGGMGLHFISSLSDSVMRKAAPQTGGPNTLILTKHVEPRAGGAHEPDLARELDAMLSVSEMAGSTLDLDALLRRIIDELIETIGAERGTLFLVDPEHDELFSRVLLEDPGVLREIRLKMGEGIAGHVAATGETINIENAYEDTRFVRDFDDITGFQSQSMLTMPMRNPQQEIIGVVQLINKEGGRFTARDERLLNAMAAQAVISIENARLYAQEIQQRLVNQELETARSIQKSFLPQNIPQHSGWEIAASWHPMREVAGDFYDFYPLPDGRIAVLIADVSGKGVPAALFMSLTVTVLRFAMSLNLAPAALLDQANRVIIANQQSAMFATVFVGYLDLATGVMEFASAGHNPPFLHRAGAGGCETLEAAGVAIGLFKNARFACKTTTLTPGDVLVFYTDGITDAIDPDDEEFGEERLGEIIRAHAAYPAQKIADLIVKEVAHFVEDQGTFDDETLVVIKRQR